MERTKEKKITVKFFLNEAVEPVKGEGRKKYYPLYVQATYNRKNMQFKSKYSEYYEDLKDVKPTLLAFEERVIKGIVVFEAGKAKDEYDLKGLKKKYDVYSISILQAIEEYLKPRLRLAIFKTGSELSNVLTFNHESVTVHLLYKAANLLFKDFDSNLSDKLKEELKAYEHYRRLYNPVLNYNFPTLIDWVDGSYSQQLENKIEGTLTPEVNKTVQALINQSVKKKLKELEEEPFVPPAP